MVSITQSMVSDAIHANGIFQVPFFTLFVEKLIEIFTTDETFVFFGRTANSHRSAFFWRSRFSIAIAFFVGFLSGLSFEPIESLFIRRFSFFKLYPVDHGAVPLATLWLLGGTLLAPILSEVPIEMSAVANRLISRKSEATTAALHAAVKE